MFRWLADDEGFRLTPFDPGTASTETTSRLPPWCPATYSARVTRPLGPVRRPIPALIGYGTAAIERAVDGEVIPAEGVRVGQLPDPVRHVQCDDA